MCKKKNGKKNNLRANWSKVRENVPKKLTNKQQMQCTGNNLNIRINA
jgi:hypothetical protein